MKQINVALIKFEFKMTQSFANENQEVLVTLNNFETTKHIEIDFKMVLLVENRPYN